MWSEQKNPKKKKKNYGEDKDPAYLQAQLRIFLRLMDQGYSTSYAMSKVGWSHAEYVHWRKTIPEVDAADMAYKGRPRVFAFK